MKPKPSLTKLVFASFLLLVGCGSNNSSPLVKPAVKLTMNALPANVAANCPTAAGILKGQTNWEVLAGRLGVALNDCAYRHRVTVGAYDAAAKVVNARS